MRARRIIAVMSLLFGVSLVETADSPAYADGEPSASLNVATFKDIDGNTWDCVDWTDENGCRTTSYWYDGQDKNYVLWIAPTGHHQWRPVGATAPPANACM